jgi:glycerol-3-phosphate dehydrogenase
MTAHEQRDRAFEALERTPLDVLVIGGGIVGTGIARDLALRGLKVGLVEQRDLASGTSSRPTRLIHGGLRYLEMFDFALVRTDMREREVLLRKAPHLVQPLRFLMPMYGRGVLYRAKLQAGMQLYDALSFDKSLPTRQWLNRRQALSAEPSLNSVGLQGAWQFYDGQVSLVERLVIENALDAANEGSLILTYARAERFVRDPTGGVIGALVRDT